MESIRSYLLTVTAAALVCGIVTKLIHKGTLGALMKLLTGLFMALTVVSPLLQLRLDGMKDVTLDIQYAASDAAAVGENLAYQELETIISGQTRAYILDKAEALGLTLEVQVKVAGEPYPVPVGVSLRGNVSPYARDVLTDYIAENLAIPVEAQKWNS